ncbi:glycosyl hydrolase catalytic core-domain-containing protein [Xylariaceae sp. FL0255]|nr:glycosyl hydrolase catalytic core-domain-containing protein [Xylariaceae sp. FL0255]
MKSKRSREAANVVATAMWLCTSCALAQGASKRGMGYIGDTHDGDYSLLLSSNSPIDWYYTWSPVAAPSDIFPSGAESRIEFVPALPDLDNLADDISTATNLSSSSTHLLTFNEPDGTTSSGGSSISPQDAATAYINQVVPLRDRFNISHPAVTGSSRGLQWLEDFNTSCWKIDSKNGCPTDFVAVHWYGDFAGLTYWLDQLTGFYNQSGSGVVNGNLKVWVPELGLAQESMDTTLAMMNQSLPYLDALSYVERYAWFGVFRPKEANEWTGNGIALLENDGGLSELGAYYLGGEQNGFKTGQQGSGGNSSGMRLSLLVLWVASTMTCTWNI